MSCDVVCLTSSLMSGVVVGFIAATIFAVIVRRLDKRDLKGAITALMMLIGIVLGGALIYFLISNVILQEEGFLYYFIGLAILFLPLVLWVFMDWMISLPQKERPVFKFFADTGGKVVSLLNVGAVNPQVTIGIVDILVTIAGIYVVVALAQDLPPFSPSCPSPTPTPMGGDLPSTGTRSSAPTSQPPPTNATPSHQTAELSPALFDDFQDGNAEGWSPRGFGNWFVENGEYVVDMGEGQYRDGVSVAGDSKWTDYTFEVDIKGERGVDKQIYARYVDAGNQYIVNLRGDHFNDVLLVKRQDRKVEHLRAVPYPNDNNIRYHVKIVLHGARILVSVDNDMELIDYTDDTGTLLTHGKIGLGGHTGECGKDKVRYDNVMVNTINP